MRGYVWTDVLTEVLKAITFQFKCLVGILGCHKSRPVKRMNIRGIGLPLAT